MVNITARLHILSSSSFRDCPFSVETSSLGESFNPYAHSPSKPPLSKNHSFSVETSSVGFSGESFNPYAHSSLRDCPKLEGLLLIWLDYHKHIFNSVILDEPDEHLSNIICRFFPKPAQIHDRIINISIYDFLLSTEFSGEEHSPSKPPPYENHSIPPPILRSGIVKTYYATISTLPNNVIDFLRNIKTGINEDDDYKVRFLYDGETANIAEVIESKRVEMESTDYVYYLDAYAYSNLDWGEDRVILQEDTNLLENTDFNSVGHRTFKMDTYNAFLRSLIESKISESNPSAHSPSKPPLSKNHSIPERRMSGGIVHSPLRNCPFSVETSSLGESFNPSTHSSLRNCPDISKYHLYISDEEHTRIINAMPWKKTESQLMQDFADYMERRVSEIVGRRVRIFNDDIWVRICRPSTVAFSDHPSLRNCPNNDYNPCHRDVYLDFYRNIVNVYVPIVGSNERSSLTMQSGSHLWNERDLIVTKGGAYFQNSNKKYSVDAILQSRERLNMTRPNPAEDEFILFSPYLIHGCSSNTNPDMTRMSVEIRFIEDDSNAKIQEDKFNAFLEKRVWR